MAEEHPTCFASVIWYMQQGFFRHVINSAVEYLRMFHNDPVLQFLKAFAILMEGRTQEAIRELQQLKDDPAVSLCSVMALIAAHKQCETVDQDAVSQLEALLRLSRKTAGGNALLYGGLTLWLLGHNAKAKDYIDRALKATSSSPQALIMKGWLVLSGPPESKLQAIQYFEKGVQDSMNAFGLMGKVEFFIMKQNLSWALDTVNQLIAAHPDFTPALVLKMNIFLALYNWEQTQEMCERILEQDGRNLKAFQMLTILALARDGDLIKAKEHVQAFMSAAELSEPLRPALQVEMIAPISRLGGSSADTVQILTSCVQRAYTRTSGDPFIATELGNLLLLQGKYSKATKCFSAALQAEDSSLSALAGLVRCQLMSGQEEAAAQQLEFLLELQQSTGRTPEVVLLQALLAQKKGAAQEAVTHLLKDATELHFLGLGSCSLSAEYFRRLDPTFLFQVVDLHLSLLQTQPLLPDPPFGLLHSVMILETIMKAAPGLLAGTYRMSQVKFLAGDHRSAQGFLNQCMEKNPAASEIHLLQARLHLQSEDYRKCLSRLEFGMSHNFQVRELPEYHLIKGTAQRKSGDLAEAIKTLRVAMNLPGVRRASKGKQPQVPDSIRVSIFLELAEALRLHGDQHESIQVMQEAILNFTGTPEEVCVIVANVDLALAKGDIDTALSALQNVLPNQAHYLQAKEKMARIYLEQKKNKKLFIASYREICEVHPGPHAAVLLGDAFMKIQEPEKAIVVYHEATEKAPRDPTFARKMGQALVKTHQFEKAIAYYEKALSNATQDPLCVELTELLIRLKQHEKAQMLLEAALKHKDNLKIMLTDVKHMQALARIHKTSPASALETLKQAIALQRKILRRLPLEQPGILDQQKLVASSICCDLARLSSRGNDPEVARRFYAEALTYSPDDVNIPLDVARLYMTHNLVDQCKQQCEEILKGHEKHTEATMMLADVMFRQEKHEEAIRLYCTLAKEHPGNFRVLSRLVQLLRRAGKLDAALPFFEACEKMSSMAASEPGYNYSKGLYFWHSSRVSDALLHLNKARRDTQWGEEALELMIRICLNPDKETFAGQVFGQTEEDMSVGQLGVREQDNQMGLITARNLMKEFRPRSQDGLNKAVLLRNLCLVHSKDIHHMQNVISEFSDMISAKEDNVNVPYLLGMAQAFMVLKQVPRARNHLKRLIKVEWNEEFADDLESGMLLLTDIYIKSGKYDIARTLAQRCLLYNKSCCKALEYLGFMMESENSYRDAAQHYEEAWRYSNWVNPTIGFRLAFNYLKYKSYTEAIDVCRKVLEEHPDYPLIQTEILNRAQFSMRP
ncbi:tetratricopeptide repeat protein 21B isoform X2 [Denticeps clupeoides]|uniref:tetratricopeptide repeat protein 21B isoform X2 n=1 Tax=Denticeps clupeoides TaxID=299321 RepID=UPI0010A3A993|nr:tetratricopeptide repeat protein 21A isoform X2 [Denticeps clupeoides]